MALTLSASTVSANRSSGLARRLLPLLCCLALAFGCQTSAPRIAVGPPAGADRAPGPASDAPEGGTPEGGTPDGGTPDGGTPDRSTPGSTPEQPPAAVSVGAINDPVAAPGQELLMTAEELDAAGVAEEEEEPYDPEEIRQQAVDACDSAEQFQDQGDLDSATAALDRAYELILKLDGGDDPAVLAIKDELRQLIVERLVDLYSSQRTAAGMPKIDWDLEIPLVTNADVQREIKSFQGPERASFLAAFERSGLYRPMILAKLQEAGLPSQLSWLPLIESNFKVKALSRASALGLWQFIRSTGNRFGLSRDTWVDERMDPEKATDAAIAYLTELHDLFGDWPKALAGYNCGASRVMRLDRRAPGEDLDFWDLYQLLPRETRRYIPRFFATLLIIEDPDAYGFELPEPAPPLPEHALVVTTRPHKLSEVDKALGLDSGITAALNPELRKEATPDRSYQLKVPLVHRQALETKLAELPVWKPPQPRYTTYRVRRGDSLSRIARKFGTSVSRIARANGIRNAHRIGAGKILRIPLGHSSGSPTVSRQPAPPVPSSSEPITYTVQRGDTLYDIARQYHTTVGQIKADNGLRGSRLYPGNRLKIRPGSSSSGSSGSSFYVVKRGDTPIAIARAHGVSLNELLGLNGLTRRSKIYPGQRLEIP